MFNESDSRATCLQQLPACGSTGYAHYVKRLSARLRSAQHKYNIDCTAMSHSWLQVCATPRLAWMDTITQSASAEVPKPEDLFGPTATEQIDAGTAYDSPETAESSHAICNRAHTPSLAVRASHTRQLPLQMHNTRQGSYCWWW